MNKKTKSIIASTLAFGTLLSASASVAPVINHTAHAATTQNINLLIILIKVTQVMMRSLF